MVSFIRTSENRNRFAGLLRSLCVAGLTLGVTSAAQARPETLRWSQTTPPEISGFRVYVASEPCATAQLGDVAQIKYQGPLGADADGNFSYLLQVSDLETVCVAVSAYNSAGESPLSNKQTREPDSAPADPGDGDALFTNDFETSATGQHVPGWVDTREGNSMTEDDSLFRVTDLGGNRVFGTSSTLTNIHSHFVANGSDSWDAYEFRGRMLITDPNAGIGVTVHSQYPSTDTYYRIMRWADGDPSKRDFYIEPHPYPTPIQCESSRTGTVPQANQWYRFRFEVAPSQSATSIRAKVWPDGTTEPANWQVRCEDQLMDRPGSGTVGVWSMNTGSKYWDDLEVITSAGVDPPGGSEIPPGIPGKPRIIP